MARRKHRPLTPEAVQALESGPVFLTAEQLQAREQGSITQASNFYDPPTATILGPPSRPVLADGTLDWPRTEWGTLDWPEIRRGLLDEFWAFVTAAAPDRAEALWNVQGPFTLQELGEAIVKCGSMIPSLSLFSSKVRPVLEALGWHFRNYGPNAAVFTKKTWGEGSDMKGGYPGPELTHLVNESVQSIENYQGYRAALYIKAAKDWIDRNPSTGLEVCLEVEFPDWKSRLRKRRKRKPL